MSVAEHIPWHGRVRVTTRYRDGRVEVVLAGSASRNRLAFEKRFEKLQTGVKAAGQ